MCRSAWDGRSQRGWNEERKGMRELRGLILRLARARRILMNQNVAVGGNGR